MTEEFDRDKENFFNPIGSYNGEFKPGNLVFNANLQEFAHKVAYLCGLEANGKITPEEAYQEIKKLWHQIEHSKTELLENTNFTAEE